MNSLQDTIETAFNKESLSPQDIESVQSVLAALNNGTLRVCEKRDDQWTINEWTKKAILLYFRIQKMTIIQAGDLQFFDKIPLKRWTEHDGVRVAPHALARYGSHVEAGAVLMPSYVNIGAYVGSGSLIDTWATIGSCAQVGKNVHISGGVGLGGVMEPLQARPVIIEDDVFIGSRCIIVEGTIIESKAVLGAGVTITASTKIIDVTKSEPEIHQGRVPANSVVIPGVTNKKFPSGEYGVSAALIIGQRKASTDIKTSLNNALREHNVSV